MGLDPSIGRGGGRRRCALRDGPQKRLAFGLAGRLGFAVALYTWASRGETLVPTLAAQTVLRVREGKAAARPMYLFGLRPLHLCGTRLEGGHRRLSHTLRFAWVELRRAAASSACTHARMHAYTPAPEQTRGRCSATGYQQRLPHRPGVPAAAGADAGTTPTAPLPLNRTVVRDLGVHPRGEFRTSGAAVGQ